MAKVASIGVFRAASELIGRARTAMMAGITFGGDRDIYTALGYQRTLGPSDYRDRYRRNGIAARVVEAKPEATWRGGAELVEDEDPESVTEFEGEWDALQERLHVWPTLSRLDILAGLGEYAVLLVGAPGDLATPMPKLIGGQEGVLYLAPYSQQDVSVTTWEEDTENPRYGLPLTYAMRRTSARNRKPGGQTVHWTRVLHVADGILDDRTCGAPRLERVWNDVDNLEKVAGGGSEAFWRRVHRGMQFDIDQAATVDQAAIDAAKEQIVEYENGLRRILTTRGIDIKELGGDVSNIGPNVTSIISLISGATGIPQRVLLGSERGELASTQDRENWAERVKDRRDSFAEPQVVRPLVRMLQDAGALPATPDGYDVRWPDLDELGEQTRAEVAERWAGLNQKAGDVVVTSAEIRDRVLKLDRLTPEQVDEAVVRVPPPPVPPGAPQVDPQDSQVE
jgi:hypothetical protein